MSSWLLRLFESEFFDSRLALFYLHSYPEKVGVQHYICQKLDEFSLNDIIFLLPQLWYGILSTQSMQFNLCYFSHLLISRPNSSSALEDFILRKCRASEHVETLTIWFIRSYMSDLKAHNRTISLKYCQKIYSKLQNQTMNQFEYEKVHENIPSAIIGIGAVLAGIALPVLCDSTKDMIISEGRKRRSVKDFGLDVIFRQVAHINDADRSPSLSSIHLSKLSMTSIDIKSPLPKSAPSLDDLSKGTAFHRGDSYLHSEISFIMTLVDIGDRLRSVTKDARQSSLIAELSLLNHNFPADVCIPLWCSEVRHHKVLRISPTDAVVLNSADRVPYLICVEIIDDDLTVEELRYEGEPKSSENSQSQTNEINSPMSPPPSAMTTESRAIRRLSQVNANTSTDATLESPAQLILGTHETDRHQIDFHRQILQRKLSVASLIQDKKLDITDVSEKLKTAAILLAQLYQQQNKELEVLSSPVTAIPSTYTSNSKARYKQLLLSFEVIRNKIVKEMVQIEEQKMDSMKNISKDDILMINMRDDILDIDHEKNIQDMTLNKKSDDPSAAVFKESWDMKKERIKANSPFGHLKNWDLVSVIVKAGADLRQEELALQLIGEMKRIWKDAGLDTDVYYYRVLVTSDDSGLIETIRDAISIHSIKKDGYAQKLNHTGLTFTLYDHFLLTYGEPTTITFIKAQENFMRSLAAYSIISYILQLKDRHNGNILLDHRGHVIHIDFGFMLSNTPGAVGFELSPFKMPQEYIDVLGGLGSTKFEEFRALIKEAFLALRKKVDHIVGLVEMMERDSTLPCFTGTTMKPNNLNPGVFSGYGTKKSYSQDDLKIKPKSKLNTASDNQYPVSSSLRDRFHMTMTDSQVSDLLDRLIDSSCNNIFTKLYDSFQYYAQGVF